MSSFAVVIIIVVLGVIIGNIMLLKHTAHLSLKNLKQDPIDQAKYELARRRKIQDDDVKKE